MGPTWSPPGSCRPRWVPCCPHEPCYQGFKTDMIYCYSNLEPWLLGTKQHIFGCHPHTYSLQTLYLSHDDIDKSKHIPRYLSFVRGIHRSPANSPHKGQWYGAFTIFLVCSWRNGWDKNRDASDFRRHNARYDVSVIVRIYKTTVNTEFVW